MCVTERVKTNKQKKPRHADTKLINLNLQPLLGLVFKVCTGADWRVRREEVKERRGGRGEDVMREEVRRKEGESGKVEERERERERWRGSGQQHF